MNLMGQWLQNSDHAEGASDKFERERDTHTESKQARERASEPGKETESERAREKEREKERESDRKR